MALRIWLWLPRKGQRYSSFSHYWCPSTFVRLHIAFLQSGKRYVTPQILGNLRVCSNAAIKLVCLGQARQMG